MDLVLAVVILGAAEVAILTLALRSFERAEERRVRADASRPVQRAQAASRFFAERRLPSERASIEALLVRLEHHVRLEQAAAESFLHNPTSESLHQRPASPVSLAN